jgi:hypothetical protein
MSAFYLNTVHDGVWMHFSDNVMVLIFPQRESENCQRKCQQTALKSGDGAMTESA